MVSAAVVSEMVLVVLVFGVARAPLLCARAVIDTFGEVLTIDMRVDVLTIMSDVTVNLLIDALADIMLGVLANAGAGLLADPNVNVFAGTTAAFELGMPCPLEGFRCWAAFDCRPMAALDCDNDLQTWMPSYHV